MDKWFKEAHMVRVGVHDADDDDEDGDDDDDEDDDDFDGHLKKNNIM